MKNKFSICSFLFVLALSMAFSVSALANHFHPVDIAGSVTAYKPADCGQPGSITINGVPIKIAAGVDLFALDSGGLWDDGGTLIPTIVRSGSYQVVGTGRRFRAYLDSSGTIRMWVTIFVCPTGSRTLSITGIVNEVLPGSITINNLKFKTTAMVAATAHPTNIVRITGSFNASDELNAATAIVSITPYDTVKICGGAINFTREGPVAGDPGSIFRTDGRFLSGGLFVCDQAPGALSFGLFNVPFAANFTLPSTDVSINEAGCYELRLDQFGWITSGSRLLNEVGPDTVCGTVVSFRAAPDFSTPTTLSEGNQQGSLVLGGPNGTITLTIAAKHKLTDQALLVTGAKVCLAPMVYDPSGPAPNTTRLPGEAAPIRRWNLLNGTKVVLQP